MEFGTIERELYIEATPEVVYDVVSSPEHVQQWWPEEASFEPRPGSVGSITFGEPGTGVTVEQLTVVDAQPHRSFSFRWTHPAGRAAAPGSVFRKYSIRATKSRVRLARGSGIGEGCHPDGGMKIGTADRTTDRTPKDLPPAGRARTDIEGDQP